MKKYLFRILVGLLAFGIGVFGVWMIISKVKFKNYCTATLTPVSEVKNEQNSKNSAGKIDIKFLGFGKKENRPTIKLEIQNLTNNPVKYRAEKKGSPAIYVKFNGEFVKKVPALFCYNNNGEFIFDRDEKIVTETFLDLVTFEFLNENGSFEFGVGDSLNSRGWTQPIKISEKLKKDIIKNAPDFFYPNRKEKPQIFSPKQLAAFPLK